VGVETPSRPDERSPAVLVQHGVGVRLRPMTRADVDGLEALYRALDADDRRRRFFGSFAPSRRFLEEWATLSERGGFGLVAVTDEPAGRIVGEAGYARLANGDGELALAVAPDWRGWLGPILLDALVAEAAARGVGALEAEILVENRPMIAMVRSRGYALVDHIDWSTVRVAIGTVQRQPQWPPPHERPRLLVEGTAGRWRGTVEARAAGFDVLTCPGPSSPAGRRCPRLSGGHCPLVDGADAIVVALRPGDERLRRLAATYGDAASGPPVFVVATEGAACTPSAELVRQLREAVGDQERSARA
jgi:RimJ/RimL family protein N-acetyltransferase